MTTDRIKDHINDLMDELTALREKSRTGMNTGNDSNGKSAGQAYCKGIEDAMALIKQHLYPPEARNKPDAQILPIHQRSAADALLLLRESPATLDGYAREDLQEAAFKFENELMACLGDMNTIYFDTYEPLDKKELIRIITRSLEDISRVTGQ